MLLPVSYISSQLYTLFTFCAALATDSRKESTDAQSVDFMIPIQHFCHIPSGMLSKESKKEMNNPPPKRVICFFCFFITETLSPYCKQNHYHDNCYQNSHKYLSFLSCFRTIVAYLLHKSNSTYMFL